MTKKKILFQFTFKMGELNIERNELHPIRKNDDLMIRVNIVILIITLLCIVADFLYLR